ncbi:GGDEF domain-containing protein [Oceanispirochaeta sp. M1]|uniref:GGDEF domain-containing protein n=2 Tax=Oceanispirochaeta TaxID=2035349 RepID=UPI0014953774|nr:GGDEF domain-containing protein [Oceanispirochaeta sp. M1]
MNSVTIFVRIDLLLYSLIIQLILLYLSKNQKTEEDYSSRLFRQVLLSLILITALSTISWIFDGLTEFRIISYWIQFFSIICTTLPVIVWMRYIDFNIFHDEKGLRRRGYIYITPLFINTFIVLINLYRPGLIYSMSESNVYSRGPYFVTAYISIYILIFAAYMYFFLHKDLIVGRLTQVIILFLVIPVIGSFMQILFYGIALQWPSTTLVLLLTYLALEQSKTSRDSLTDLYTRSQFEQRLYFKIKRNDPFSLILIDMNDFKYINDNFGHNEGDKVLKLVTSILISDTNPEDLVCRYGGDEFILLIESDQENVCSKIIDRLDSTLSDLNSKNDDYRISMSYGYKFIKDPLSCNKTMVLKEIDENMYKDKKLRKAAFL